MYVLFLDTLPKTNGIYDSHGISGETFFIPSLKVEYPGAYGVSWKNIIKP
jgi:hypothetical protein